MNPSAAMSVSAKTALAVVVPRGRGPEKVSTDKGFGGDSGHWDKRPASFRAGAGPRASGQNGTETAVPERHRQSEEPRLSSSFVAQLLGQVLVHPDAVPRKAGAAYGQILSGSANLDRQF